MKKLFTLIAITSAIIPAIHGMDTALPTEVQKKYDNLTVLIQNADVDAFKTAFDTLTLPAENIAALRQTVVETKTTVANELEAMGDKTKSWSKIIKSGLASIYGLSNVTVALSWIYYASVKKAKKPSILILLPAVPALTPLIPPAVVLNNLKISPQLQRYLGISATTFIAYKAISYGIKTLKTGLNYKEHLQNMLANLDAIDAHITQAKA